MINVVGASAVCGKCRSWSETRLHLPAWTWWERIKISSVCLHQICRSSASFSFDHIRGVTHWWSLIPRLEKGFPTKRSDVIYLKPLPHPHLLKKYNMSVINDEVGVNPPNVKIRFLEQCWWSVAQATKTALLLLLNLTFSYVIVTCGRTMWQFRFSWRIFAFQIFPQRWKKKDHQCTGKSN